MARDGQMRPAAEKSLESGNLGELFFAESEAVHLLYPVFNGR